MVIDTSVLVAMLLDEPGAESFERAIAADPVRLVSAPSLLEASIVVEARYGDIGGRELDLLVHQAGVQVVAFTAEHLDIAREAWRRFGRGRHAAGLNYGDCFSYALARSSGEPLLFKGGDFSLTDIPAAV
jgi:ribonuclease VapC